MNKNIRIAKELVRIAKMMLADRDFNFMRYKDFGPEHQLLVSKSEVYAYQLTDEDVKKILNTGTKDKVDKNGVPVKDEEGKSVKVVPSARSFEHNNGDGYKTSEIVEGAYLCTADVGEDAGAFWLVQEAKFGKKYKIDSKDTSDKMNASWSALNGIDFFHYEAVEEENVCFRLPEDMDETTWKGQRFTPGSYVFIENNKCDIYQRTAKFMQAQYHLIEKKSVASVNSTVQEQYFEIIGEVLENK